jgi:hypothetical protein
MTTRFDREQLDKLRLDKRLRNFYRLNAEETVEHEFRDRWGHPSSYAFVRLRCRPADDLSVATQVTWPTDAREEGSSFERAIAEGIADVLLDGIYHHSGCELTLIDVRYDRVGSSYVVFMKAAGSAIQELLKW